MFLASISPRKLLPKKSSLMVGFSLSDETVESGASVGFSNRSNDYCEHDQFGTERDLPRPGKDRPCMLLFSRFSEIR